MRPGGTRPGGAKSIAGRGRIWTIPNALTAARLFVLVPIFICLVREERVWAAFWCALGACTDLLDGFIARRLNQASDLGRLLDPVVDKVAVLSVVLFLTFSPAYGFPLWFLVFLLARETAVVALGFILLRKSAKVSESNRSGKWSAFTTGIAVILVILGWQPYARIAIWIAFGLTLFSSFIYLRVYLNRPKAT